MCRGYSSIINSSLISAICLSLLVGLGNSQEGEGIAVGKPKIFDNRALTLMLEQCASVA